MAQNDENRKRYDSSKKPPDSKKPEAKESEHGFYSYHMPGVHNDIAAAKHHEDVGELDQAHQCLDACERHLENARKDTERRIEKRDSKGEVDSPRNGRWFW